MNGLSITIEWVIGYGMLVAIYALWLELVVDRLPKKAASPVAAPKGLAKTRLHELYSRKYNKAA